MLGNDARRYGAVAVLLHWGMAALLVVLAAMGVYMVALPDVGYDTWKITLILVHKALGMVALALAVARFAWRLTQALPRLAAGLPAWQQVAARYVHLLFYALMFALPVTGWLMSSAGGFAVSFFGWFEFPDFIAFDEYLFRRLIEVHKWLGWALVVLLVVHAGAALRHHLLLKDDTLLRMLPLRHPRSPLRHPRSPLRHPRGGALVSGNRFGHLKSPG